MMKPALKVLVVFSYRSKSARCVRAEIKVVPNRPIYTYRVRWDVLLY
jgi:hypothetical protein